MTEQPLKITFLQGQENLIDGDELESNLDKIKQKISKYFYRGNFRKFF